MHPDGRYDTERAYEVKSERNRRSVPHGLDIEHGLLGHFQSTKVQIRAHLYDTIEADLIDREGHLVCGLNIDGVEGRIGMNCFRFGFEKFGVDRFDKFPPLFVRIDSDNPVVRDFVLPEEVQEADRSALCKRN